jgi:hypothetical protein
MKLLSEYFGEDELAYRGSRVYLHSSTWSAVSQELIQTYLLEFITKNTKVSKDSDDMIVSDFETVSLQNAQDRAENWVMGK